MDYTSGVVRNRQALALLLFGLLIGVFSSVSLLKYQILLLVLIHIMLLMGYILLDSQGNLGVNLISTLTIFVIGWVVFILGMPITWLFTGIGTAFPTECMLMVLLLSFVGLISWGCGYFLPIGYQLGQMLPRLVDIWDKRRLFKVITGLILLLIIVENLPGVSSLVVGIAERLSITVLLIITAILLSSKRGKILWIFLCVAMFLAGVSSIIFSARREMLKFVLGLVILWHFLKRPVQLRWVIIGSALIIVLVLEVGIWRTYPNWDEFITANINLLQLRSKHKLLWFLSMSDYAIAFENLEYIISSVPDRTPYLGGVTYLKPLLWWVPRSLWPEKPENITRLIVYEPRPHSFAGGTSQGVTMIGEMYWNLGLVGVVVGMYLFGLIARVIEVYARPHTRSLPSVVFYALTVPMLFEQFRGGFDTILFNYLSASLIPLIVVSLISRHRSNVNASKLYTPVGN